MNSGEPIGAEQGIDSLAAFDDALAANGNSSPPEVPNVPGELQTQVKETMAYAQRVRMAAICPPVLEKATIAAHQGNLDFGRFELLEVVGSGGFGTVFRARDTQLQRVVAIKVPRAGQLANAQEVDRFFREARSVAQLRHPGIVSIHEVGQQKGLPYLVCEYVKGVTLAQLLAQHQPTPEEAVRLLAEVADALHYAHEHGVVHRDVKPANILIDEAGTPHLMDFGLARRDAVDVTITCDGQVLGTPAYMSPEQARGESHRVDRCADVYSLGVILYQLLTGALPFQGTTRAVLNQVLHEEPRPPRSLNDEISNDLETICLKAMAKQPASRYSSAAAMANDLRYALSGQPITARPVGIGRFKRWYKHSPTAAALVAIFVLVSLASATILGYLAFEALGEKDRAMEAAMESRLAADQALVEVRNADDAKELARQQELNSWRLLNVAQMSVIAAAWQRKDVATVLNLLETLRPGSGQEDLRSAEWYKLWRLTHGYRSSFGKPTASFQSMRFSSDGKTLAAAGKGQVRLIDVATGFESAAPASDADLRYQLCSKRDGNLLVLAGSVASKRIQVFKLTNGKLNSLAEISEDPGHMEVSPDGTMLAVIRGSRLSVWDVDTGQQRFPAKELESLAIQPAFSPDGKTLAVGTRAGKVRLFDTGVGEELRPLIGHTHFVAAAAFSADGRLLATGSGDHSVRLWDVATWKTVVLKHQGEVHAVRFSPDGTLLASGDEAGLRFWNVADRNELATLYGHTANITSLFFSPDGRNIASASDDKSVKLWDVPVNKSSQK